MRIAIALTLAAMGLRAQALEEATLMAAEVAEAATEPQPCLSILAAMRLLNGDVPGAEEALAQAPIHNELDRLRWHVVRAELDRRAGNAAGAQRSMDQVNVNLMRNVRSTGRLFPEVYTLRGVVIDTPPWTVRCSLAGPVRLWMYDIELPLRSTRPAAGLLALLVTHGGRVSRERALDALDLPGRTPDARRKALSAAVAELREVLGWPESVAVQGGVLALSEEPVWLEPEYPAPGREDLFCEGRYDPWVLEWRSERLILS
ncbi:hypothetical protein [Deinococcus multiflagellatus]|uniref:hypothetical protein n=1 Tax=Deinococcus multiflagellatus TaxID=1656887 RepID=UPI001CCB8F1B|nr:hypothetical protein [Deinococcus multiflagellatus]MBZ9712816.1 hypothetical protein [Deinococcus multiflagellatus]